MQRLEEQVTNQVEDKITLDEQKTVSEMPEHALALPSEETIVLVREILAEQKQNPSPDNFCRGLFKTIYSCLDSQQAHIYNSSRGVPAISYAVMTTEPKTFSNAATTIYTAEQLLALTALTMASVFSAKYGNRAYERVNAIYKHLSAFSNGFSFAFSQSCLVAAQIEGKGNLPGTPSVYASLGIVLGESFAMGLLDAYAQSRSENSLLRKCTESLMFALTFGNTFSQAHRIYNFFNGPQPKEEDMQTFVTCIPLIISATTLLTNICYRRKDLTLAARLGTVNNLLSDFGTIIKAQQNNDALSYFFMGSQILISSTGYCLIKHYNNRNANPNLNASLLANEAPSQAIENNDEPESPSLTRSTP